MKRLTFRPTTETAVEVTWPDPVQLARYRARRTWLGNRWRATEYAKRVDTYLDEHPDTEATWQELWDEIDAHELPLEEFEVREEWTSFPLIVGAECVESVNGDEYEPATMPEHSALVAAVGLSVLSGDARPLLVEPDEPGEST